MVELVGEYDFTAPQELVWEMLMDPDVLAMTIAGCEKLERVDDTTLLGRLNLRIGPVQGFFQGKVESSDVHPPSSMHMTITGNGPAGAVRGEGNITLEAIPGATRMRYDGTAQISGRIASVGQRVIDSSAKSIVKQSLQNLDRQIQARLQPAAPVATGARDAGLGEVVPAVFPGALQGADAELPPPPGQIGFALNITRDIAADALADFIPDPQQRKLVVGAGVVVAAVALLNLFAELVARRVARRMKVR